MPIEGGFASLLETTLKGADGKLLCEKVLTGKPNPGIVKQLLKEHNIDESELSKFIMIGDNPQSDIAMGNGAGIDTCLTLTGFIKSEEEAQIWSNKDSKFSSKYII